MSCQVRVLRSLKPKSLNALLATNINCSRNLLRAYSTQPPLKPPQTPPHAVPHATAHPTAHTAPPVPPHTVPADVVKPRKGHPFKWGLLVGLGIGIAWAFLEQYQISMDSKDTIQPPTKSEAFPMNITADGTDYQVLGVGVRTVSIFKFHVYAVGIYIAKEDVSKARGVLAKQPEVEKLLADSDMSEQVVSALLAAGVRFAVRIMPVRNTDFAHMRDGFVRSVTNNAHFKEADHENQVGEALGELKRAFGRKRRVPKGDVVTLTRGKDGELTCFYSPNENQSKYENLGVVHGTEVSRLLFLQYLAGKNPNSPSAAKSSQEALVQL